MIYWKSVEDKFLDGELLFVPSELKEKIENENFRVEKRELIYLIWAALKSTPVERRSDWRRVHHGRFDMSQVTLQTAQRYCGLLKMVLWNWIKTILTGQILSVDFQRNTGSSKRNSPY